MVLAHLRKERFLRGEYNKLKMKKIRPCRILKKKKSMNSYEIELPMGIGISPIFSVTNLYPYQATDEGDTTKNESNGEFGEQSLMK